MLLGPNTGLGLNSVVFMIEPHVRYVDQALELLDQPDLDHVEVRPDAETGFLERTQLRLAGSVGRSACKNPYLSERRPPQESLMF